MEENAQFVEELRKAIADFDTYEHGMNVLDTDYENFLMLYHCREDEVHIDEYNKII